MAPISLESMEFYVPLSQPRTAGSSAQEMPPASSTAAVTATATATVSANDQRAQRAEARQRAEKAPSNNIDTSFPQMEAEDTGPSDEPMPSAEGVEGVHDDEGTSGPWIEIDDIISRSDSNDNVDGLSTVEELLFSGGKTIDRAPGSQVKPIVIEDDGEDHDSESTELDEVGSSVRADRNMSRTPPTTVASSSARTPLPSARKRVTKESDDEAYSFWALNTGQDKGEHVQPQRGGHSSNVEGGRDGDHNSAADVTDATGSGIDEMDHADIGSRLRGIAENNRNVASASLSTKRKLPLLATGRSIKSNSAPQHNRKRRRRHCFSASEPSDGELDTDDETSGSIYIPRGSSRGSFRGRRPPRPSHLPQRERRFEKPQGQHPRQWCSKSFPITSLVANRAVIFELQRWRGEIVDERRVKQERGRPRKQYLIEWEPSWVDSGRLAAPGLIEDWEENGRTGA